MSSIVRQTARRTGASKIRRCERATSRWMAAGSSPSRVRSFLRRTPHRAPQPQLDVSVADNDEAPWLPVVSRWRHDRHADQATDRVRRYVVAAVLPDGTAAG